MAGTAARGARKLGASAPACWSTSVWRPTSFISASSAPRRHPREPGPFRTVVSARFRQSAEKGLLDVKSLRWIGEPEIRWADDGRTWIYDRYAVRM